MAWARSEDRECNCSFDIRGVLGKHVIVLLDHLGSGFSDGLKIEYKSNCIKLTYESWSVKALLMLMDRNAKTTPPSQDGMHVRSWATSLQMAAVAVRQGCGDFCTSRF